MKDKRVGERRHVCALAVVGTLLLVQYLKLLGLVLEHQCLVVSLL